MRTMNDKKKLAILKAAGRVFPRKGFHKTLMDDVAKEAKIGKGTIYRYFPNKEGLFFSILENANDELYKRLVEVRKKPNAPTDKVIKMVEALADFVIENRALLNLVHEIESKDVMKRSKTIKKHNQKIIKVLADELENGARAGKFKQGDYELWAGMMAMASRGAFHFGPAIPKSKIMKSIIDLFFYGIAKN